MFGCWTLCVRCRNECYNVICLYHIHIFTCIQTCDILRFTIEMECVHMQTKLGICCIISCMIRAWYMLHIYTSYDTCYIYIILICTYIWISYKATYAFYAFRYSYQHTHMYVICVCPHTHVRAYSCIECTSCQIYAYHDTVIHGLHITYHPKNVDMHDIHYTHSHIYIYIYI